MKRAFVKLQMFFFCCIPERFTKKAPPFRKIVALFLDILHDMIGLKPAYLHYEKRYESGTEWTENIEKLSRLQAMAERKGERAYEKEDTDAENTGISTCCGYDYAE